MYGDQYGEFVCGVGVNSVKNVSEYQGRSSATLKRIIVTFNVATVVVCLLVCLFAFLCRVNDNNLYQKNRHSPAFSLDDHRTSSVLDTAKGSIISAIKTNFKLFYFKLYLLK